MSPQFIVQNFLNRRGIITIKLLIILAILSSTQSISESLSSQKTIIESQKSINVKSNFNYSFHLPMERKFESIDYVNSLRLWMNLNWYKSIIYAFIYILFVFILKAYMKSREKYELKLILTLWNIILAIFSTIGAIRVIPELMNTLVNHGFAHSICDNSYGYGITGYWSYMFIMSKLPELLDTLFIILRKQQLIFLHWYHHATVLIYCWYSYHDFSASGRWFINMNYVVHSLMYTYYALKTMKYRVSRHISKCITTLQILQMIVGCVINYYAWLLKSNNHVCNISNDNIKYSFIMYATYFLLFFHFFLNSYILKINKNNNNNNSNGYMDKKKN